MPPKSRQQRRPVVISDDDDASEKGAGDEVDQWVVGIVARAKDEDGNQYFLVRWGADDEGKPFDVGREEETWEPAEHVQGCFAFPCRDVLLSLAPIVRDVCFL